MQMMLSEKSSNFIIYVSEKLIYFGFIVIIIMTLVTCKYLAGRKLPFKRETGCGFHFHQSYVLRDTSIITVKYFVLNVLRYKFIIVLK